MTYSRETLKSCTKEELIELLLKEEQIELFLLAKKIFSDKEGKQNE